MSVKGTDAADWDKNTWPPLQDLAQSHPEAGVHFQRKLGFAIDEAPSTETFSGTEIYNRKKDVGSATATW